jgi:hypothetical protein
MELGSSVAEALHLRRTNYLSDNFTLAEAAAKREPNNYPGHWSIRPSLNQFVQNTKNQQSRVFKINKSFNEVAHKQAQEAYRLHDIQTCLFSCLGASHNRDNCPVAANLSSLNVHGCTLLYVTCL